MQAMTANVNQLARRRELPAMPPCSDVLVQSANRKECHYDAKNGHLSIVQCRVGRHNLGSAHRPLSD